MAWVAGDWSIAINGDIRYIGNDHNGAAPSYVTVIEFHRQLQDYADDQAASGNDILDISSLTPSDRSTDNIITLLNGYNIDDTAAEHIYDGSIIQTGGDTVYDGIVNFGNASIEIGILQNGAVLTDDWWNFGGVFSTATAGSGATTIVDSGASWTTNEWIGYVVHNTTDGSAGLVTANDGTSLTIAAGMHGGTADTNTSTDAYYIAKGLNSDAGNGISHRFMIKTRSFGVNIDGKKVIGFNRTYGRTYGEFVINATASGNNVLALSDATDLNNATNGKAIYTSASFVAPFTTITNSIADGDVQLIDVNNDTTDEEYYTEWNRGTATINQFYEYCKYVSRYGADETTELTSDYGFGGALFRGVTHSFAYDGLVGTAPVIGDRYVWGLRVDHGAITGTFAEGDAVSFASGAVGRVLLTGAADMVVWITSGTAGGTDLITNLSQSGSCTATTVGGATVGGGSMYVLAEDGSADIYVQLLIGSMPANDVTLYRDAGTFSDTIDMNGTATSRALSYPFVGASTGSALIGAYGLGVEATDLTQNDLLTSLDGNTYQPPNFVTFTVGGLVHDEDRVLVTSENGSTINKTQLSAVGPITGGAVGSIVVQEAIPSDTPSSGTIRVVNDSGFDVYLPYTSWATSTFTLTSTYDFSGSDENDGVANGNNVYLSYIDELAQGSVVSSTALVSGVEYEILTVSGADYTTVGAADNNIGTRFTATGTSAGGTGTVYEVFTSASFTVVYSSSRSLFIRVRDGGGAAKNSTPIKTFETTGTLGSTGGSVTAIRTADV